MIRRAVSTSYSSTTRGGASRNELLPQPSSSRPFLNARATISCGTSGAGSRVARSFTNSRPTISPRPRTSPIAAYFCCSRCAPLIRRSPIFIVEQELLPNVVKMGDRLISGAHRLQQKYAAIGDVRGRGLMVGLEFVKDRATREPAPEVPHEIVARAFRKGLLLLGCGKSSLRLAPPLVVDEYDVDTALRIIDECLREMSD